MMRLSSAELRGCGQVRQALPLALCAFERIRVPHLDFQPPHAQSRLGRAFVDDHFPRAGYAEILAKRLPSASGEIGRPSDPFAAPGNAALHASRNQFERVAQPH
jgi:hypothetical protein